MSNDNNDIEEAPVVSKQRRLSRAPPSERVPPKKDGNASITVPKRNKDEVDGGNNNSVFATSGVQLFQTSPIQQMQSWVESVGKNNNKQVEIAEEDVYFPDIHKVDKKTVSISSSSKEHHTTKVPMLSLLSYSTTKEKWFMFIGLIMASLSGLCLPAWLVLLANSLNKFSSLASVIGALGDKDNLFAVIQNELNNLVIAFAILGGVSLFTGTAYVGLWTYTGERQAVRIKKLYVKSALKQDATFFDLHNREEMPTEIANSMIHINGAIGRNMADIWSNLWTSMGCLTVAFLLNWQVALLMMAIVPIAGICILIISCFIRKNSKEAGEQFASAGALATEVISGIKTIASLNAEEWSLNRYESLVRGAQKSSIYSGYLAGLSAGITGFLFYCIYVVAFAFGTYQVAENSGMWQIVGCFIGPIDDINTGNKQLDFLIKYLLGLIPEDAIPEVENCHINGASVMCCIYGVILCATFFGLMAPGLNAVNQGRQAAVDIFNTIKRIPDIDASSNEGIELKNTGTSDVEEGGGKGGGLPIKFNNVLFAYPSHSSDPIFRNFTLSIDPGTSVALVGPSGSGKSTVARLLLRFYDPTDGNITIDGVPLSKLNIQWWRKQIGYVGQDPILFPGTIMDNIRCGNPSASDEDVIEAAKAANADEFISTMPNGYDTFFTGTSIQLSGGQLQRICIARAMIRKPSILLLDEATSALDTNSEKQVQDAIERIRTAQNITTVTIAHRLSTIVSSDQIAVISDGCIAELGNHKELLSINSGIYANLCQSQGITLESSIGNKTDTKEQSLPSDEEPKQGNTTKIADSSLQMEKAGEPEGKEEEEEEEEELASMSRLWSLGAKDWPYVIMGMLGSIMVGALSPAESILTANIVANFYTYANEPDKMFDANRKWILGFVAFAIASIIGNVLSGIGHSVVGYRLTRRMRCLVFEAIIRRSMGWFDVPEHSTGELTTRLEGDAEAVSKVTGWSLGYRIRVMVSLTTGVVIALVYSWQIGLTAIACVPLVLSPAVIQKLCLSKRYALQQDGLSPSTILEQGLRGINSIQAYNLQGKVFVDYSTALIPEEKGKTRKGIIAGLVYGLSQGAIFVSFAIVFWLGSELLTQKKVDFVGFFTPVLAVMFGAVAVAQVNADFNATQDGRAAAARIFAIVDEPLDDKDPFNDEGAKPSSLDGSISYNSIGFHYPTRPNAPIFYPSQGHDGFSLSIASKESVAFVGKSGSGKSTALQILLRFYDQSSGSVILDSRDIQGLNMKWLRGRIGYVGQMPVLFAGTVRENILMGDLNATEEQVMRAAKAANAHEFIMNMSNGYDSEIGSGGGLLSGGQRQRVAIARAIVSNPDILVLDEATAALDNESERIVQAALDELQATQPRTTLVVAHRLVTVKNCDKIAVLGGGGVKEIGTHDSLLNEKGLYHELWTKQVGSTTTSTKDEKALKDAKSLSYKA